MMSAFEVFFAGFCCWKETISVADQCAATEFLKIFLFRFKMSYFKEYYLYRLNHSFVGFNTKIYSK